MCEAVDDKSVIYIEVQIALIFCMVWSETECKLYIFLGCTRACVCGCDGDVICIGHDLNRCTWVVVV